MIKINCSKCATGWEGEACSAVQRFAKDQHLDCNMTLLDSRFIEAVIGMENRAFKFTIRAHSNEQSISIYYLIWAVSDIELPSVAIQRSKVAFDLLNKLVDELVMIDANISFKNNPILETTTE